MLNELVLVTDKRGNEFYGEVVEITGVNNDIIKVEIETGDIVKFYDGVDEIYVVGNQTLETSEIKELLTKTAKWEDDYIVKCNVDQELSYAIHSIDLYIDGEYVDEIANGSKSFIKRVYKRLVANRKRWGV